MANIQNLDAEIGANFIGDDAQPSLTFANSSTGPGLSVGRLHVSSGASIDILTAGGVYAIAGTVTVSPLQLTPSALASAPAIKVATGGYASITSVVLTTVANTDYAIRVWVAGQPRWIPCFLDAALVGTAAVA